MTFFPENKSTCILPINKFIKQSCASGLVDIRNRKALKVKNENFDSLDYSKILKKFSPQSEAEKIYQYNKQDIETTLPNPEIPIIMIYMKSTPTEYNLRYPEGLLNFYTRNVYPTIDHDFNYGDATLPANSSLVPSIKWAYEFNHKSKEDSFKHVNMYFYL